MHAFALVSVQVRRAAVGDLFEQQVDVSSARQRGGTQQLPGCVPSARRFVHGPVTSIPPASFPVRAGPGTNGYGPPDGAAGHARDLGVGQPLEMVKDHHCPLGERQRGQRVGDRVDGEVALGLRGGLRAGSATSARSPGAGGRGRG